NTRACSPLPTTSSRVVLPTPAAPRRTIVEPAPPATARTRSVSRDASPARPTNPRRDYRRTGPPETGRFGNDGRCNIAHDAVCGALQWSARNDGRAPGGRPADPGIGARAGANPAVARARLPPATSPVEASLPGRDTSV